MSADYVYLSANEAENYVSLACQARGLERGLAADAGAAIAWLCRREMQALVFLQEALDRLATYGAYAPRWNANGRTIENRSVEPLSILRIGPSLLDFLYGSTDREPVGACNVDLPALMFGYLGSRPEKPPIASEPSTSESNIGIAIRRSNTYSSALASRNSGLWLVPLSAGGNTTSPLNNSVLLRLSNTHSPLSPSEEIVVPASAWQAIVSLAEQTRVVAGDASRLRGAGAGLVDKD